MGKAFTCMAEDPSAQSVYNWDEFCLKGTVKLANTAHYLYLYRQSEDSVGYTAGLTARRHAVHLLWREGGGEVIASQTGRKLLVPEP